MFCCFVVFFFFLQFLKVSAAIFRQHKSLFIWCRKVSLDENTG